MLIYYKSKHFQYISLNLSNVLLLFVPAYLSAADQRANVMV